MSAIDAMPADLFMMMLMGLAFVLFLWSQPCEPR